MSHMNLCKEETRNQCKYFCLAQSDDDALDIIASVLSYLVLWVFPEETLFPTGLAMYTIPCIFSAVKFSRRTSAKSWQKKLFGIVVVILGIISFFGLNNGLVCSNETGNHLIIWGDSLKSLTGISQFSTCRFLLFAGMPLLFTAKRFIFPKWGTHSKASIPSQAA